MVVKAVLLLGGNRGDVSRCFELVRVELELRAGKICAKSKSYTTEAWGFEDAEPFLNQAVAVKTELSPIELLDSLQKIESIAGRDRAAEEEQKRVSGERYLSRCIDIDILLYGDEVVDSERLQIPHPHLCQREFALRPLCDICPEQRHPKNGRLFSEILYELSKEFKNDEV